LVGVVDKMLVLKAGKQVAFGDAKEMLEAVRKLQVVAAEAEGNAMSLQPSPQATGTDS
jgi:ABC-type protease/lipase transport system fused ATPase/permease subunit